MKKDQQTGIFMLCTVSTSPYPVKTGTIPTSQAYLTRPGPQDCMEQIKVIQAQNKWLMPVILPTWDAEIRKIAVRGLPRQEIHENPISTYSWMVAVAHACHPNYSRKRKIQGSWFRLGCAKVRPYLQK
jgi:hypothetical protein